MICVPSATPESFGVGPRDLIHSLSVLLGSFRGGNPAVVGILQEKLMILGLSVSSPQQKLDVSSSEDERERDSKRAFLAGTMSSTPRSITWRETIYTPATTSPFELTTTMDTTIDTASDYSSDYPVMAL